MKVEFVFAILLASVGVSKSQRSYVWSDKLPNDRLDGVPRIVRDYERSFPAFKNMILKTIGTSNTDKILKEAIRRQKAQKPINESVPFFCDVTNGRSKERPTSVHALRPGDIDVIAALGDSLTAGNGALALNTPHLYVENRGICAMIGGQGNWRKFLTLPNILKEFNPKLIGYSTADSFTWHPESQFDVGEPGAMVQDLPYMTKQLVKRIKKHPKVDFQNDWKLVTLLIGANNLCVDICYVRNLTETVEEHRSNLMHAFKYLQDNMPRTLVNFILMPNIKVLHDCTGIPFSCDLLHKFECPCLFTLQHQSRVPAFFKILKEWQRVDEEVARDPQFRIKEDFAIVLQNFTKELVFPTKRDSAEKLICDMTYLSEDCFHFSQKGYARATNALWNNMLEPDGLKTPTWPNEFHKFLCPTERSPYIYTWKNSQL